MNALTRLHPPSTLRDPWWLHCFIGERVEVAAAFTIGCAGVLIRKSGVDVVAVNAGGSMEPDVALSPTGDGLSQPELQMSNITAVADTSQSCGTEKALTSSQASELSAGMTTAEEPVPVSVSMLAVASVSVGCTRPMAVWERREKGR
jgi:hypothetical protein